MLTDPASLQQFLPFLGRECSVRDAAGETGAKPNSVLWRVKRWQDLGLIEVTRKVPRGGRAVKLYRSVADCFFVPFEVMSAESMEAAMASLDRRWEDALRRAVVRARRDALQGGGYEVSRDGRGVPRVTSVRAPCEAYDPLEPNEPAAVSSWHESVHLTFEQAKALQAELLGLLARYAQEQGSQQYLVRLGLAPLLKEDL